MSSISFNEITGHKYRIKTSIDYIKERFKKDNKELDKEDRTVMNSLQKMYDYLEKVQKILSARRKSGRIEKPS